MDSIGNANLPPSLESSGGGPPTQPAYKSPARYASWLVWCVIFPALAVWAVITFMMLTHYVAIDDSHGNAGSDWLLEAGVSPAGRTNLLTHARVTNKTAEVQLLEVAEKSSSPFKGVAKAYFHAVGIVGKILICLPLAWLLITIACSFGRDWETQYRRLCICWLVFLGGAFAYGVFALLNKQITVISFIVYVLIILVVAFLVWTRMKKVEKGLYDAILESTTRSRRKFQIIRQIREECEKQK